MNLSVRYSFREEAVASILLSLDLIKVLLRRNAITRALCRTCTCQCFRTRIINGLFVFVALTSVLWYRLRRRLSHGGQNNTPSTRLVLGDCASSPERSGGHQNDDIVDNNASYNNVRMHLPLMTEIAMVKVHFSNVTVDTGLDEFDADSHCDNLIKHFLTTSSQSCVKKAECGSDTDNCRETTDPENK
uniref:Uncharacterized protein n=1 Tax=Trypanosoma vivax (strain Y486) TaxID=1055687 RepID=G0TWX8_TRYVY|nr:conserved hypothetical protein [Trypanosoma vivax Y486]